ncbi:MAG: hypothetical protein H0T73_05850, partial [Ardenticatenales bacterium]|nr:hypothetical protein [Ardenticatenales bacterium]
NTLCDTNCNDVAAFEMLGPPRLSKLLYEGEILLRAAGSTEALLAMTPERLGAAALRVVEEESGLRRAAISVGIPILLPDGDRLLRGPEIKADNPADGWVDLRRAHMAQWQAWIGAMLEEAQQEGLVEGLASGSGYRRAFNERGSWQLPERFDVGEMVAWIFRTADEGERIKE